MQPLFRPKEEVENGDFHLSDISTIFDRSLDGLPDFGTMSAPSHSPSNPGHGHHRSISSESASSLVQRTHPSRTHASLGNYRGGSSPNSMVTLHPPPNLRPTPSVAMSRKDIPRYLAPTTRRRSAGSEDEDLSSEGPEPPGADATEQEKIEYKRRMNTLAARRSRRRRLAQFHQLEDDVARLNREKDIWKERALMMERMLSSHGLPCPNFER